MRLTAWIKGSVIVAGLCLAGLAANAQQQSSSQQSSGDPVADAARRAREEKKNAPKPKKVFTDDDVSKRAPEPASAAPAGSFGTTTSTGNQEQQPGADAAKEDPNGEKAWRKRFQAQHDKIAKAEKELDVLQREEEKAQVQYYTDPQKAMLQQNSRAEVNAIHAKIDTKKQEIAQLKQALDDMETDLRKAGGDPGWAR
jgi:chromosome segregation ATPase